MNLELFKSRERRNQKPESFADWEAALSLSFSRLAFNVAVDRHLILFFVFKKRQHTDHFCCSHLSGKSTSVAALREASLWIRHLPHWKISFLCGQKRKGTNPLRFPHVLPFKMMLPCRKDFQCGRNHLHHTPAIPNNFKLYFSKGCHSERFFTPAPVTGAYASCKLWFQCL